MARPSFLLPTVTNGDKVLLKYLQSFGFSRTANPHNLELPWYGTWNHTLQLLVRGTPALFVAPQYPLRFIKDEDEDPTQPETNQDGVLPDLENNDDRIVEVALEADDDDDEIELNIDPNVDPDTDSVSDTAAPPSPDLVRTFLFGIDNSEDDCQDADLSMVTTSSRDTSSRITDFAIIFLIARNVVGRTIFYEGWKILFFWIPIIIEIKRFPSRSLSGVALKNALLTKIREARTAAIIQALHLFQGHPQQKSVVIVAASGPFWSYTFLKRSKALGSYEYMNWIRGVHQPDRPSLGLTLQWSNVVQLNTLLSDNRLEAMRRYLVDFVAKRIKATLWLGIFTTSILVLVLVLTLQLAFLSVFMISG